MIKNNPKFHNTNHIIEDKLNLKMTMKMIKINKENINQNLVT